MTETKSDLLLTQKEAASYLRISLVSLWRLRRSRELPYKRALSKVLYRRADLDAYLDRFNRT